MAVKVIRTRIRPNTNVDFVLQETDSQETKYLEFEGKMLEDGKIIFISNDVSDDQLTFEKTFIFSDAQSLVDYFFFLNKNSDTDFLKANYDNNMHQITNNITTKFVIDWNFTG